MVKKWSKKEITDLLNVKKDEGICLHLLKVAEKYNRSTSATRIKYYKELKKIKGSSSIIRKKRWTEKEDELIRNAVRKDASNLSERFHDLSYKLNRSYLAINHRYYSKIRYEKTLFSLIDERGIASNTKNGRINKLYKKGKFIKFFKEIVEKIFSIFK